ncbi:hypothetical protein AAFF_G00084790 [Aldrovandia affinis]|uniref:Uncharacterized protein n=1 Tax=Aldrovandia affinis TaxID=143900 RepID=A0AAD7RXA4_9TELE|nr:hypothetical protein AAFF_G00084790 [Aldrovandia affinis]
MAAAFNGFSEPGAFTVAPACKPLSLLVALGWLCREVERLREGERRYDGSCERRFGRGAGEQFQVTGGPGSEAAWRPDEVAGRICPAPVDGPLPCLLRNISCHSEPESGLPKTPSLHYQQQPQVSQVHGKALSRPFSPSSSRSLANIKEACRLQLVRGRSAATKRSLTSVGNPWPLPSRTRRDLTGNPIL